MELFEVLQLTVGKNRWVQTVLLGWCLFEKIKTVVAWQKNKVCNYNVQIDVYRFALHIKTTKNVHRSRSAHILSVWQLYCIGIVFLPLLKMLFGGTSVAPNWVEGLISITPSLPYISLSMIYCIMHTVYLFFEILLSVWTNGVFIQWPYKFAVRKFYMTFAVVSNSHTNCTYIT